MLARSKEWITCVDQDLCLTNCAFLLLQAATEHLRTEAKTLANQAQQVSSKRRTLVHT